jgi:hypothetical protein
MSKTQTSPHVIATRGWSCSVDKDFKLLGEFMDTASKYTLQHEYHFSNGYVSLFHAPAVQIWIMRENPSKRNKLTKYRKKLTKS